RSSLRIFPRLIGNCEPQGYQPLRWDRTGKSCPDMRNRILTIVMLVAVGSFCSLQAQKCLEYGPTVTLTGKVASKVFPGPPNYMSIRKGDRKETAMLLTLAEPICTNGNNPAGIDVPESGLRDIQLAIAKSQDWA